MPTVADVMTRNPVVLPPTATMREAAKAMADNDIGDVLVGDADGLRGIVTDRDLVVRGMATDQDPSSVAIESLCTSDLRIAGPDDEVGDVIRGMRDGAIRRMPVCRDGDPVGVLSLGDLAVEFDADSVLAAISDAPADE